MGGGGGEFAEASDCARPFTGTKVHDPSDVKCVQHLGPEEFMQTVEEYGFDGLIRACLLALMIQGVHFQLAADVDEVVDAVYELLIDPW